MRTAIRIDRHEHHPRHALDPAPEARPAPLAAPTRTALEWDGARWAEIDPATGYVLSVGDQHTERSDA